MKARVRKRMFSTHEVLITCRQKYQRKVDQINPKLYDKNGKNQDNATSSHLRALHNQRSTYHCTFSSFEYL